MRVKNISESVQIFTDHTPFQPGEERDVPDEQAELLLRSPFIQAAERPKSTRPMKAVEPEEK